MQFSLWANGTGYLYLTNSIILKNGIITINYKKTKDIIPKYGYSDYSLPIKKHATFTNTKIQSIYINYKNEYIIYDSNINKIDVSTGMFPQFPAVLIYSNTNHKNIIDAHYSIMSVSNKMIFLMNASDNNFVNSSSNVLKNDHFEFWIHFDTEQDKPNIVDEKTYQLIIPISKSQVSINNNICVAVPKNSLFSEISNIFTIVAGMKDFKNNTNSKTFISKAKYNYWCNVILDKNTLNRLIPNLKSVSFAIVYSDAQNIYNPKQDALYSNIKFKWGTPGTFEKIIYYKQK